MNNATANLALPSIMTTFGMSLDQAQWVITAYMIATAVTIPTVGWLGNVLGNRNLLLFSLMVFVGGSALCGLAWSGSSLIAFRILQGLGGGPVLPMAMTFSIQAFPPHQRGLAMGLYGLGLSCGPVIGPVLGGYVTEYLHWRMVFYLNTLPGTIGMLLVLLVIPNTRAAVKRVLDAPGLIALTTFLVSLLFALSQGRRYGWDSSLIQLLFVFAGLALIAFVTVELSRKEPLVDLHLLANPAFAASLVILFVTTLMFSGTNFLQVFLLQRLFDYTPAQAGRIILPGALTLAVTMVCAGRLIDTIDRRLVVWVGLGLFALTFYAFSFLTLERSASWMIWLDDLDDRGALSYDRIYQRSHDRHIVGGAAAGAGAYGRRSGQPDSQWTCAAPGAGRHDDGLAATHDVSQRHAGPGTGFLFHAVVRGGRTRPRAPP
jgi:EmrB/QacA subfamily drug resistance transporter